MTEELVVNTHVMISRKKCLKCKHLCSENAVYYKCNNTLLCPAKYYKIILGLDIDKVSVALGKALATNDTEKISKITDSLQAYDDIIVNEVMTKAKRYKE